MKNDNMVFLVTIFGLGFLAYLIFIHNMSSRPLLPGSPNNLGGLSKDDIVKALQDYNASKASANMYYNTPNMTF